MGSVWSILTAVSLLKVSSSEPKAPDDVPSSSLGAKSDEGASTVSSRICCALESCSTTTIVSAAAGTCKVCVADIGSIATSSESRRSHGPEFSSSPSSSSRRTNQNRPPATISRAIMMMPQKPVRKLMSLSTIPSSRDRDWRVLAAAAVSSTASATVSAVSSLAASSSASMSSMSVAAASSSASASSASESSIVSSTGGS